jgi:hypothetical protein
VAIDGWDPSLTEQNCAVEHGPRVTSRQHEFRNLGNTETSFSAVHGTTTHVELSSMPRMRVLPAYLRLTVSETTVHRLATACREHVHGRYDLHHDGQAFLLVPTEVSSPRHSSNVAYKFKVATAK